MFELLMAAISSSGFGAILGAVNGFVQRVEERKNLGLRFDHEQVMADKQLLQSNEELEGKAFLESQEVEGHTAMTIKAFVRPVILLYLLTMTTIIAISLNSLVGGLKGLESQEVVDLYKASVYMVLSLTSMGVSWYFAQRTSKQFDTMLSSINAKYNR